MIFLCYLVIGNICFYTRGLILETDTSKNEYSSQVAIDLSFVPWFQCCTQTAVRVSPRAASFRNCKTGNKE
jgi:hypothetical protein